MRGGRGWAVWDLGFVGVLVVLFLGWWMLYRLLIKKDLKDHLDELRTAGFFMVVMVLIYWWLVV